jgi:hypothetical protein
MPDVQESQGLKTLHNELTADLEKIQSMVTKEYILKVSDLNVAAKKMRYPSEMVLCPILWGINLSHIYAREVR